MSLRVGAARADITPGLGVAMGGYGARTAPAAGVLDPLLARAVTFADDREIVALVVCDLLGVSRRIVEPARRRIAERHGIGEGHVLIASTHTHAGPMAAVTADDAAWVERAIAGITEAVGGALADARAATLKSTHVEVDSIGRNRRDAAGPRETRLKVVVAEDAGGHAIATILSHACHATVLEADNLQLSADFPGAANRAVERAVGGVSLYLQGACADVNPVWLGHTRREVERIGGIVGTAGARAVHELRAVGEDQRVINLSWGEELAVVAGHGSVVEPIAVSAHQQVIEVARRVMPSEAAIADELDALRGDAAGPPPGAEGRRARARRHRLEMERIYGRSGPAEPGQVHKAEVQVIRIGPGLAFVGLPGEFFTELGWEIERRSGVTELVIVGYANNYLGYVPPATAFADDGYEVGCARFEPDAAAQFVEAAISMLATS